MFHVQPIVVSAVTVCLLLMPAADKREPIAMKKVPILVRDMAKEAAPGVKFTEAFIETEEGNTVYGMRGKNAQGKRVEVDVTANRYLREVA
jgi:uncharacterized membrane protein YkoI